MGVPGRELIRYGSHRSQLGELFLPDASAPSPVAVLLHGGFWRARYDRRLMDDLCRDLAGRGWAAWNLEYRRVGLLGGGGWPATFEDVAAGIDNLAGNVALDLGTVATIGHSAGGHLALWAAARVGLPAGSPGAAPLVHVTQAVSQGGVVDLHEAARLGLGHGAAPRLLGGKPEKHPDRYELASPASRLPLGVPQLLVHGEQDDLVPTSQSRGYHAAATAAGDPVDLAILPGVGHFEHLDPTGEAWRVVTDWLAQRR